MNYLFRLKLLVPAIYLLGALVVWFNFSRAPPDGLANIGLVLYTLPVVIVGSFILKQSFPYFPGNYYEAHALYFSTSVALLAICLFLFFLGLERLRKRRASSLVSCK